MPTKFETISASLSQLPWERLVVFALSGATRAMPFVERYASEAAKSVVRQAILLLRQSCEGHFAEHDVDRMLQQISELPDVGMDDSKKPEYTGMKAIGVVADAISVLKKEATAQAVCAGLLNLMGGIDYLAMPYRPSTAKKLSALEEEIELRTIQMLKDARNADDLRSSVDSLNKPFTEALEEILPVAERRLKEEDK
jgi:hypothetical protein